MFQEECLGTIKSASDVENLKNHVDFSLLGDASKSALFEKLFEVKWKNVTVNLFKLDNVNKLF